MPSGSCLCGGVAYSFEAEPQTKALCHCLDCRKISGSAYSTNAIIKDDTFKWTSGKPKEYRKVADSGKNISSYFCPDCGSTIARVSESFPGMMVVKTGTLDEFESVKPEAELYASRRASWIPKLAGTSEVQEMS